jgi:hypothetical protein
MGERQRDTPLSGVVKIVSICGLSLYPSDGMRGYRDSPQIATLSTTPLCGLSLTVLQRGYP